MAHWLVLRVAPQKEFEAAERIAGRGHQTLCPYEQKWRRKHSRTRHKKPHKYPVFTRYVFAGIAAWPQDYHDIKDNVEAVQDAVGFGGRPAMLTYAEIQWIRTIAGRTVELGGGVSIHKAIEPGAQVVVSEGPFQGRTGTASCIVGRKAHVLLELFNSMQQVEIPLAKLERA